MPKKENKNLVENQSVTDNDDVETAETNAEETTETAPVVGFVVDCGRLNIRKNPVVGAAVVIVIPAGSKLTIDEGEVADGWISVSTEAGVKGFCMKKFVAIRR